MYEIQAPDNELLPPYGPVLFLAGTIDQGNSFNWQAEVLELLVMNDGVAFNPRRDSWDDTQMQDIHNGYLRQQINWELTNLKIADVIYMRLLGGSASPVSLLELGLFANEENKLIVCCDEDFYRYPNVKITCDRYKVPCYTDFDQSIQQLKRMLW